MFNFSSRSLPPPPIVIAIDPELREYSAGVTHALRTPLTILRLKLDDAGSAMQSDLREELAAQLERLAYVIEQSILISQADRGLIVWRAEHFNLAQVLHDLVDDFRPLLAENDRQLVTRFQLGCSVDSDVSHVRCILHEYLNNAVAHGEGDVQVSLSEVAGMARLELVNDFDESRLAGRTGLGFGLRVAESLVAAQERVAASAGVVGGQFRVVLDIPLGLSGI